MKVKLARNLSKLTAAAHGLNHERAAEGATVEVEDASAETLVKSALAERLIEAVPKESIKAIPKASKKDE